MVGINRCRMGSFETSSNSAGSVPSPYATRPFPWAPFGKTTLGRFLTFLARSFLAGDTYADGVVNFADLNIVVGNFGDAL